MGVTDKEPLISVIIPTTNYKNKSDSIEKAVESVLQQQNCHFEIIVVDDSTAQTKTIEKYSNVRYIKSEKQGITEARNLGIAEARGDLVVFLDTDYYFLPDKLATQSAIFAKNFNIGIVHSGWQHIIQDNKTVNICLWKNVSELDLAGWLRWKPVFLSAIMFRREWLEYVGGFDSYVAPADDTDVILRMVLKGCKTAWLKKITVSSHSENNVTPYISSRSTSLAYSRSLYSAIDRFFSQPDLPSNIKLIEYSVLYRTNVWLAWCLYRTKHFEQMTQYLKQSCQYSPFSPLETTIDWIESFATFSKNWAAEFDIYELTDSQEWQYLLTWIIKNPFQRVSI